MDQAQGVYKAVIDRCICPSQPNAMMWNMHRSVGKSEAHAGVEVGGRRRCHHRLPRVLHDSGAALVSAKSEDNEQGYGKSRP